MVQALLNKCSRIKGLQNKSSPIRLISMKKEVVRKWAKYSPMTYDALFEFHHDYSAPDLQE